MRATHNNIIRQEKTIQRTESLKVFGEEDKTISKTGGVTVNVDSETNELAAIKWVVCLGVCCKMFGQSAVKSFGGRRDESVVTSGYFVISRG